jgi:hypothetical protein
VPNADLGNSTAVNALISRQKFQARALLAPQMAREQDCQPDSKELRCRTV